MFPGRNFPPRRPNRRENVNELIRVREVRAVFPDGTAEVMQTSVALRKAQEMGLDLVLVAPTAVPPVAKAVDYGHYQYEQKKKQHDAKKKQHVVQGKKLLMRFAEDLASYGAVEGVPRLEGRNAHILISPVKAGIKPPDKTPSTRSPQQPP